MTISSNQPVIVDYHEADYVETLAAENSSTVLLASKEQVQQLINPTDPKK